MSRRPSEEEINRVHDYIEYCIMHYKTKKEAMDIIASQANIEPVFTQTIWEELERQNRDCFEAYYIRLSLIHQIRRFNSALFTQAELMRRHNGLHPRSNASQQALLLNGLHPHSNASQQVEPMHPDNGLLQCPHAQLMQQHNGLHPHSNASQPMHQHNMLPQCPSAAQHALMQQHNRLHPHSNASQQAEQMHRQNELLQCPSATQHARQLMQQHDMVHPHSNASQPMHQHNEHAQLMQQQEEPIHTDSTVSQRVEMMMDQDNGVQELFFNLTYY